MQLEPETIVGAYRVEQMAGRGAFGEVYRARRRVDDSQPVALKLLSSPDLDDRKIAGTLGRLDHPNIVRTLDSFSHEGRLCLVQEWADGGSVEDELADGALETTDVVRLGRDVASALDYAHRRRIVHRDVKPSNVLIVNEVYKLGDFGIGAALEHDTERTVRGQLAGTPLYMSPEQALGQPLSPASDIFALGLLLYRATYGRLPEEAGLNLLQLLDRRIRTSITVPAGSPFGSVIELCLALDPDERPRAEQVADYFSAVGPGGLLDQPWDRWPPTEPPEHAQGPSSPGIEDPRPLSAPEDASHLGDWPYPSDGAAPPDGEISAFDSEPYDDTDGLEALGTAAQRPAPGPGQRPSRADSRDGELPRGAVYRVGGGTIAASRSPQPLRTALGAAITGVVAAAVVGVPLLTLAWLGTAHGWAWPVRIILSCVLVGGGLGLSGLIRERLASKVPEIERQAADVLFEADSRIELTQSLMIEVDELVRRLRTIDGRILGVTLKAMVDEYDMAKVSSDRIAALVNVVTIVEKLRIHLSPWHVRHKEAIATSVAVVGGLSGLASVASGFLT